MQDSVDIDTNAYYSSQEELPSHSVYESAALDVAAQNCDDDELQTRFIEAIGEPEVTEQLIEAFLHKNFSKVAGIIDKHLTESATERFDFEASQFLREAA